MRVKKITKGNGRFRKIYCPSRPEMRKLKDRATKLAQWYEQNTPPEILGCVHGFRRGRSMISNAQAHVGYEYTISMDLRDFFDSVTPQKVVAVMGSLADEYKTCFRDGAARQGLPSSPVLANIACRELDRRLLDDANACGAVYTRYADDITISFRDPALMKPLTLLVEAACMLHDFDLAPEKTRIQSAKHGRRLITGVGVSSTGIHPTRRHKRRLRAMQHQGKIQEAVGMYHWLQLYPPNRPRRITVGEYMGYTSLGSPEPGEL